jgi:hypothetical protein
MLAGLAAMAKSERTNTVHKGISEQFRYAYVNDRKKNEYWWT